MTVELRYSNRHLGYFANRKDAAKWVERMVTLANTPERVSGQPWSYSPLSPDEFEIVPVVVKPITYEQVEEILKGLIGGWENARTRAFIADREKGLQPVASARPSLICNEVKRP